jgi:hypothetical protein
MNSDHFVTLDEMYQDLLEAIEPDFLVLAEAYHIPDSILQSAIGASNGTPYQNLLRLA